MERKSIDNSEIGKEKMDRMMVVGKEIGQKSRVRGERSDGHCKKGGYDKEGKDSECGDFWQREEKWLGERSVFEDLEVTFGRLVKLEELIARSTSNRVKLEKTTNYLAKVVEDLQLEAEEEEDSVQPSPGKASFGSTDVRLKKKRVRDEVNLGSTVSSTPVSGGQPLLTVELGLESFKSTSVENLHKLPQQVEAGAAEVSEGRHSTDLQPERIASGRPEQEEQNVVERKSESVVHRGCWRDLLSSSALIQG